MSEACQFLTLLLAAEVGILIGMALFIAVLIRFK